MFAALGLVGCGEVTLSSNSEPAAATQSFALASASLVSGTLTVFGHTPVPHAVITLDGCGGAALNQCACTAGRMCLASGAADSTGAFALLISDFDSPGCALAVSDGRNTQMATLAGCYGANGTLAPDVPLLPTPSDPVTSARSAAAAVSALVPLVEAATTSVEMAALELAATEEVFLELTPGDPNFDRYATEVLQGLSRCLEGGAEAFTPAGSMVTPVAAALTAGDAVVENSGHAFAEGVLGALVNIDSGMSAAVAALEPEGLTPINEGASLFDSLESCAGIAREAAAHAVEEGYDGLSTSLGAFSNDERTGTVDSVVMSVSNEDGTGLADTLATLQGTLEELADKLADSM